MKQLLFFFVLLFSLHQIFAQTTIIISTDKTSSLVFPQPILHVDRGAKTILAQGVKDAPHVLLIKAAAKNFSETNLSVVTVDGSVYAFAVRYAPQPEEQVYQVAAKKSSPVQHYATGILDNPKTIKGIRHSKWDMMAEVRGIYIQDDVLYFQLQLHNNSPIDYEPELMRFFIRDRKKAKRTAVQEQELTPLLVTATPTVIKAMTNSTMVIAVQKFTIPDAKLLLIQFMEKNGGRHLQLKVSNKKLMQSIMLPEYTIQSPNIINRS